MIRTPSAGHSVYRPAGGSAAAGTSIREGRQTQQRDNREQASQATGRLTRASGWQVTELITAVCVLAVTGLRCACSQGPEGGGAAASAPDGRNAAASSRIRASPRVALATTPQRWPVPRPIPGSARARLSASLRSVSQHQARLQDLSLPRAPTEPATAAAHGVGEREARLQDLSLVEGGARTHAAASPGHCQSASLRSAGQRQGQLQEVQKPGCCCKPALLLRASSHDLSFAEGVFATMLQGAQGCCHS